ncbi:PHP domain-containing protein [Maridesulfovibrio hydrothermalis]|uniref:PHP domain protein n=1 Tax=Maridesulfovibrio hydrothermalis AM13 = DSM 14728 TaxID=1121451 RepID=L0R9R7_9BACT|nr:PHP domain-containing protein [Maridesulfovibrio hydrothermalis]CCO22952.1 PHP domain protein [Maridesulfovibrio hydrothermalis AM13 = DSM 14728]
MPAIDLHTHSTASDGTFTPAELVKAAKEAGLVAIALTDHDTMDGLPEALEAGVKHGIEVIPGCELSVRSKTGVLHIVGLWVDPYSETLKRAFNEVRNRRISRNEGMVANLQKLGIDITMEEIRTEAPGTVGRPHMARILVAKKVVKNFEEAFNDYLGSNGKAYIPKNNISPEEAFELLKSTNATSILAHPFLLSSDEEVLDREVAKLKNYGLEGIEVYYNSHSIEMTGICKRLARKYDLMPSGGSDFHGFVKPDIMIGKGTGNLFVHHSVLDDLKSFRQSKGLKI